MTFYRRKLRLPKTREVLGFRMLLDPHECVDSALLFMPQLYEHQEVSFIKCRLKKGDTFLDIGANVGFYTLLSSKIVGAGGMVIAIEASPSTFSLLKHNLKLNECFHNILPLNIGVSNKNEILSMNMPSADGLYKNRGANSFLNKLTDKKVPITCKPLCDIVQESNLQKINGIKIDIEGFEYRVLFDFLNNIPCALLPDFIIIEQHPNVVKTEGDTIALLKSHGFQIEFKTKYNNYVMVKRNSNSSVMP
jgi:FkbM family methyltransferase